MCTTSTKSVKSCKGRRGGLKKKLYIEMFSQVANVPEGTDMVIPDPVTFVAADASATPPIEQGGWSEWAISKYDGKIVPTNEGDDENPAMLYTASGRINAATAAKNNIFKDVEGRDCVAVIPDGSGTKWFFGENDEPATITLMQEHDAKNGYTWTITFRPNANFLKEYTGDLTIAD